MRSRPNGFTLLEVLVAIVVLGVLIALVQQGFAVGLRATTMQARVNDRQADLDAVDQALRDLIRRADPGLFPEPATLSGTAVSVSMVTTLPTPAGRERANVTLFEGGGQVRLRWTPRRHVEPFGPPAAPRELVILSGVDTLRLAYFDGSAWLPSWTAERLPLLVRLTIGFSDSARHWPPIVVAPIRDAIEQ
jgi:general secretion pathway protein J